MTGATMILGNKAYSSWSLRAWLIARHCGLDFEEVVIPLDQPGTSAEIHRYSTAGRVPILRVGKLCVWDTLAIAEYLNEGYPQAGLWPAEPSARATARAVTAEMHAGFAALRKSLPMDLRRSPSLDPDPAPGGQLGADIKRILEIWTSCRTQFGQDGDFLFGKFGIADAFFAPVVTRFATYGIALDEPAAAYRDAVLSLADMRDWIAAAKAEPWTLANP